MINNNTVEALYDFFKSDYDRSIASSGWRSLKFLDKYEKAAPDVFIKSVKLLFAKQERSPFIVRMYFAPFFIKQMFEPDDVIRRFSDNFALLEEIHTFVSLRYHCAW